jgi:hypothetical protein
MCCFCTKARDSFGNNRDTGGDDFIIALRGSSRVDWEVTDHDNGMYTVTYTTRQVGRLIVGINLGREKVPGDGTHGEQQQQQQQQREKRQV